MVVVVAIAHRPINSNGQKALALLRSPYAWLSAALAGPIQQQKNPPSQARTKGNAANESVHSVPNVHIHSGATNENVTIYLRF